MSFREMVGSVESMAVSMLMRTHLKQYVPIGHARMRVSHKRPSNFALVRPETMESALEDKSVFDKLISKGGFFDKQGIWLPDPKSYLEVDEPEEVLNQITNSGRDQLHLQGYGSSGLATNGFNYIGLSNDSTSPAAGDTSLTSEITSNGLSRTQGVYAHTAGTNTSTIDHTFTATGAQSCQKAALFNLAGPPVAGIMNHELLFTQRSLISGDTIDITYTITLG